MRKLLKRIGSVGQNLKRTLQDNVASTISAIWTITGAWIFSTGPTITAVAPATPVANVIYSDLVVKGWLETSGAGAWTIDADVNVSSITDNGVGDLTINWATAFGSSNYAVVGIPIGTTSFMTEATSTAKTASLVRLGVNNDAGVGIDPAGGVSVMAIGAQ